MDLQAHFREQFGGKRIILVGNATFRRDCSQLIDEHDIVIRFNLFHTGPFVGRRIHYWLNNFVRDRERREGRVARVPFIQHWNPEVVIGSPHEPERRLKSAVDFFHSLGFDYIFPDTGIDTPFLDGKQPRTGFYTAFRLVQECIPAALIGFTAQCDSPWHDGAAEMQYLRAHSHLLTLHEDF